MEYRYFALILVSVLGHAGGVNAQDAKGVQESVLATVDFNDVVHIGKPEVFGAVVKIPREQAPALDLLERYGIRMMRVTVPLNAVVPEGLSIEQFSSLSENSRQGAFKKDVANDYSWALPWAKDHNITTFLSISYTPSWLAWSTAARKGKEHFAIPRDWGAYEKLVSTAYSMYGHQSDIIGVWVEPNFLILDKSPYSSRPEAYSDIALHSISAIRRIDPSAYIVGPNVAYSWRGRNGVHEHPEALDFVKEMQSKGVNFDGLSLHYYGGIADISKFRDISQLPIYVSEWNASSGVARYKNTIMTGKENLAWVGKNLLALINQGVAGSSIYAHVSGGNDSQVFGTFRWDAQRRVATPTLSLRPFGVLSRSLGLGDGDFKVVRSSAAGGDVAVVGAVNSKNHRVVALSNDKPYPQKILIEKIGMGSSRGIDIFLADENNEGLTQLPDRLNLKQESSNVSLTLPPFSLTGILLK